MPRVASPCIGFSDLPLLSFFLLDDFLGRKQYVYTSKGGYGSENFFFFGGGGGGAGDK